MILASVPSTTTERGFERLRHETGSLEEMYMSSPLEDANQELRSRAIAGLIATHDKIASALSDADFEDEIEALPEGA